MLNIFKTIIILTCLFEFIDTQSNNDNMNRLFKTYENIIIELQKEYQLPSISVAIVSNKKIIYESIYAFSFNNW